MADLVRPPFLDPEVEYAGVSKIRYMNTKDIRELRHPLVVTIPGMDRKDQPVAVLITYEQFIAFQRYYIEVHERCLDLQSQLIDAIGR